MAPILAEGEIHFMIPGPNEGLSLFLRQLQSTTAPQDGRRAILYVHGATFPSALSVAHRFEGKSWRDALNEAGFDVWGLDFQGFGFSDRYLEMQAPADASGPLCLAADAAAQLACAARFILDHQGLSSLSLLAHSWGSMAAARFAGEHPTLVDRLALFGPIACRQATRYSPRPDGPAWRIISVEDQWARFVEDVPLKQPNVLSPIHFEEWAGHYLDSDSMARNRQPEGVKIPAGPFIEIMRAWQGEIAYDPALVQAPVGILRGEWDGLCTDADAAWLFNAFANSKIKRDVKIGRATHLMHLESMRLALWRESITFLLGGDVAPVPL